MSSSASQLTLPTIELGWEILTVEDDRKAGKFTAELLDKNEGKRNAVVEALAQGMAIRSIAKAYEISVNTVLTAKRRFGAQIETEKQRLGRDCFDVARMAVERMRDEIEFMPRQSLPIIAGIMSEKGLLLTGAPTARIEHIGGPSVASVADYIASLPSAVPVDTLGNSAQKGSVVNVPSLALSVASDRESPVQPSSSEGSAGNGQIMVQSDTKKDGAP